MSKSGKLVEVYDPNLNLCLHCVPPEISNTSMVSGSMLSMKALHSWYMTTRAQSVVLKPILIAISLMRSDLGKNLPTFTTSSTIATTPGSNSKSGPRFGQPRVQYNEHNYPHHICCCGTLGAPAVFPAVFRKARCLDRSRNDAAS